MATSAPDTIVAPDFASILACKAPIVIPEIRQLVIKLAPLLTKGASAPTIANGVMSLPPTSAESAPDTIVSSGSPSTPVRPTLTVNILEGLITQVIDQFVPMMECYTDLVLNG